LRTQNSMSQIKGHTRHNVHVEVLNRCKMNNKEHSLYTGKFRPSRRLAIAAVALSQLVRIAYQTNVDDNNRKVDRENEEQEKRRVVKGRDWFATLVVRKSWLEYATYVWDILVFRTHDIAQLFIEENKLRLKKARKLL